MATALGYCQSITVIQLWAIADLSPRSIIAPSPPPARRPTWRAAHTFAPAASCTRPLSIGQTFLDLRRMALRSNLPTPVLESASFHTCLAVEKRRSMRAADVCAPRRRPMTRRATGCVSSSWQIYAVRSVFFNVSSSDVCGRLGFFR